MGMKFSVKDNMLTIQGGSPLHGADVTAVDLRAGVALVLAGMVAEGKTTISDAWQIERGYDSFVEKLRRLGGRVSHV